MSRGQEGEVRVHSTTVAPHNGPGWIAHEPGERIVSPLNYVIGGALIVVATVLAIDPVRTLASSGDCVGGHDSQGRCSARVHFGARAGLELAGASAALLGGAAVLVLRPIRMEASAGPEHALARLSLSF